MKINSGELEMGMMSSFVSVVELGLSLLRGEFCEGKDLCFIFCDIPRDVDLEYQWIGFDG